MMNTAQPLALSNVFLGHVAKKSGHSRERPQISDSAESFSSPELS